VLPDGEGGLYLVAATKTLHRSKEGEITPVADVGSSAGAVARGPDGALYLGQASRITRVDGEGRVSVVAEDLGEVYGVSVDAEGGVFVTDWAGGRVLKVADGETTVLATGLEYPSGIAVDGDGALYVKESGRQTNQPMRVRKITSDGEMAILATVPRRS
jgi:sugar lactone lactonase YvrE